MLKRVLFLSLLALLAAANTVNAYQAAVIEGVNYPANSPEAWLLKLHKGLNTLNYTVSFVVVQPNAATKPYLWRHGIVEGGTMEHLSLLNGPGTEIFRVNDKLSYFEPNSVPFSLKSKYINGPIPIQFFKDPIALNEGYDFVLVGRSRVSGKPAQQIRIVSRDGSRYNTTVWLDQETGLLLKMDTLDRSGQLIEQLQVTSLQVDEKPDPYFEKIDPTRLPEVSGIAQQNEIDFLWQINWIPAGMEIIKKDVHRLVATSEVVEYMMLSDGLVDVSVYISKVNSAAKDGGWLIHESNTLLSLNNGKVEVSVVGKIPAQTANAIASSIGPSS